MVLRDPWSLAISFTCDSSSHWTLRNYSCPGECYDMLTCLAVLRVNLLPLFPMLDSNRAVLPCNNHSPLPLKCYFKETEKSM